MKTCIKTRNLVLAGLLCFVGILASADSVNTISINGTARYGYAETTGDFTIKGPGLGLSQAAPDGPNIIGYCTVGAVCNLTFSPLSTSAFCSFCIGLSGGSLGSQNAQYIDPHLTFTGSAFYSGGNTLLMPFTVTGTITGYELVNCTGNIGCSLGPEEFTVQIFAQGTEEVAMNPLNGSGVPAMIGTDAVFSGTATVVPEPTSLVLTGTGLLSVWTKMKMRRANKSSS